MAFTRRTVKRKVWHRRYWTEDQTGLPYPSGMVKALGHTEDAPMSSRDSRSLALALVLVLVVPALSVSAFWLLFH